MVFLKAVNSFCDGGGDGDGCRGCGSDLGGDGRAGGDGVMSWWIGCHVMDARRATFVALMWRCVVRI